ncbi:MAG: 2-C-methyl-D-erythritol 4-phosphate cytidylyltransferase [Chlamydiales bacterium]
MTKDKVGIILLAGGRGLRLGTPLPKQFLPLSDKIVALYSLEVFFDSPEVGEVVVVCDQAYRFYFSGFPVKFANPGKRRQDSVYQGLQEISDEINWICIHDAARPFISSELLKTLFQEGRKVGAAAVGQPVKWTVKEIQESHLVKHTLNREAIWEVQTPQFLAKNILKEGFARIQAQNRTVTDDVSLAEAIDHPVKMVKGSDRNLKITTPVDLEIARSFVTEPHEKALKYRLHIAYDGTAYSGWQLQPNAISIQGLIENNLNILLKKETRVIGAGRTDAGVHALKQVAHFTHTSSIDVEQVRHSLNALLPPDIRIKALEPTLDSFHAMYSAVSKEYHYHIWLEPTITPFLRLYRHHCPRLASLDLLKEGAARFVGTHDFKTFANVGSEVKATVRTLHRLDVYEEEGGVRLEFEGDGFLYKMVRNIVGTLLEIATQKRKLEEIDLLFEAKDRRRAGVPAPARGLFLKQVNYPSHFQDDK